MYRVTSQRSPKEGKKKVGSKEGKGTTSTPQRNSPSTFSRLHFLLFLRKTQQKRASEVGAAGGEKGERKRGGSGKEGS